MTTGSATEQLHHYAGLHSYHLHLARSTVGRVLNRYHMPLGSAEVLVESKTASLGRAELEG